MLMQACADSARPCLGNEQPALASRQLPASGETQEVPQIADRRYSLDALTDSVSGRHGLNRDDGEATGLPSAPAGLRDALPLSRPLVSAPASRVLPLGA